MKYIKIFETYRSFKHISLEDYDDSIWHQMPFPNENEVRKDIQSLKYSEQEEIINFFKQKYNVTESLDSSQFIDNEVVIGFNRVDGESSCWVNLRLIKMRPKTIKWPSGRTELIEEVEITISKVTDEWFYVRSVGVKFNDYVKCDQIYGVMEYLKTRF